MYHMEALWYCFNKLLQEDLTMVKEHWNSHYIRKLQHETVSGIPDILYFLPEYHGGENCLMDISAAKFNELEESLNQSINDDIYKEYFDYVLESNGWFYPDDVPEGFEMFQLLLNIPQ